MGSHIGLFKVNIEKNVFIVDFEICSKLLIKTPDWHSGVFIVNFEQISNFLCVFRYLIETSINKAFFDPLIVSPTKWSNTLKQFG